MASLCAVSSGSVDLVRGGEDGRRVLGDRELAPGAVEDRPARARDLDHLDLLALRLGAERAAVDALDPDGAHQHQPEEDDGRREQQADAAVDQVHGAPTAPAVDAGVGRRGGGLDRRHRVSARRRCGDRSTTGSSGARPARSDPPPRSVGPARSRPASVVGRGRLDRGEYPDGELAVAKPLRRDLRRPRARSQVAERAGSRHHQAELRRDRLDLRVREPARDLRAQGGVLAPQRVRRLARVAGGGAEAERDHVEADDPDQQRPEQADPQPAAGQPDEHPRVGEPADGARRRRRPGRSR